MIVDNPEGVKYFQDLLTHDPKSITDKIILRGYKNPPSYVSEDKIGSDIIFPEHEILCFAGTPYAVFGTDCYNIEDKNCIKATSTSYPNYQVDKHYLSLLAGEPVLFISPEEMLEGLAELDPEIFKFLLFHLDLLK